MYCTRCGLELKDDVRYCSQCGTATVNAPRPMAGSVPEKRLMRSRYNGKIAGVCAGLADYLDVDPVLVRLLWLVFVFFPLPGGVIAYIIAWIVLPQEPERHVVPVDPLYRPA
jgi:phage shock protein C